MSLPLSRGERFDTAVREVAQALALLDEDERTHKHRRGWGPTRRAVARDYLLEREGELVARATRKPSVFWGLEGQLVEWGFQPGRSDEIGEALVGVEGAFEELFARAGLIDELQTDHDALAAPLEDLDRQWGWSEERVAVIRAALAAVIARLTAGAYLRPADEERWLKALVPCGVRFRERARGFVVAAGADLGGGDGDGCGLGLGRQPLRRARRRQHAQLLDTGRGVRRQCDGDRRGRRLVARRGDIGHRALLGRQPLRPARQQQHPQLLDTGVGQQPERRLRRRGRELHLQRRRLVDGKDRQGINKHGLSDYVFRRSHGWSEE